MIFNSSDTLNIFFGGDVYLGEHSIIVTTPVKEYLSQMAWGCVNLEAPIIQTGGLSKRESDVPLYSSHHVLALLKETNVEVVSLANNHITDWGYAGVASTLDILQRNSIQWVGAGLTQKGATEPLLHLAGSTTIGLLSFGDEQINCENVWLKGYGCNPMLEDLIKVQIKSLKGSVDIIIVQFHSGLTNYSFPSPTARALFRSAIDWGADVVIRHHPHVLQGIEYYRNGLIVYSLGNLVFAPILRRRGMMNLSHENHFAIILAVRIRHNKFDGCEIYHTRSDIDNSHITLCNVDDHETRHNSLLSLSKPLEMDLKSYASFYTRYWYMRMFNRCLWRFHPSRLRELSLKHLMAAWVGWQRH
jgi:poly-gamma-glutamate capsule biosynthesis protein CapA/YwtB (metallophosphatase superfamily)